MSQDKFFDGQYRFFGLDIFYIDVWMITLTKNGTLYQFVADETSLPTQVPRIGEVMAIDEIIKVHNDHDIVRFDVHLTDEEHTLAVERWQNKRERLYRIGNYPVSLKKEGVV